MEAGRTRIDASARLLRSIALNHGRRVLEPVGDLLARPAVIVIEVDDHRANRDLLLAAGRAAARHVLETVKEPIEPAGHRVVSVVGQQVDALVSCAEGTRAAFGTEVRAERLRRAAMSASSRSSSCVLSMPAPR
jgi:hypothetical protein